LALLCAVAFLALAAVSVVNIALPSIRRDLHMPVQNVQWILSGYLLTFGGFMLLGGRSADLFGRRRMLLAGQPCSRSRRSPPGWPRARVP